MGIEIERKFLVKNNQWRKLAHGLLLRQGYIRNDKHCVVRIRIEDKKGFIAVKGKTERGFRMEYEYEIARRDGEEMLHSFCQKPIIVKKRYFIHQNGSDWIVDEFLHENRGLVVAEIELDTIEQSFEKPGWIGQEITNDPKYLNANLVHHPFQSWQKIQF